MVTELSAGSTDLTAVSNAVRKLVESLVTPAIVCVACTVATGTAEGAYVDWPGTDGAVVTGASVVGERVGCMVGENDGARVGVTVGSLVSPTCEG